MHRNASAASVSPRTWTLAAEVLAHGALVDAGREGARPLGERHDNTDNSTALSPSPPWRLRYAARVARMPAVVATSSFAVTLVALLLLCRAFLRCQGRAQARLYASDRSTVEALRAAGLRARSATSAMWLAGLEGLERSCPEVARGLSGHAYARVPCSEATAASAAGAASAASARGPGRGWMLGHI